MKLTEDAIKWTKEYLSNNENVVIGISGGIDSSTTAAILKEAIGVDRIYAVMMPCGEQKDIEDSKAVIKHLGLRNVYEINIGEAYDDLCKQFHHNIDVDLPLTFTTNTPARLRMTTLYGVAAMVGNCRVVNTCNVSEDVVGYSTKFGDHAGDFGIINHLTKTEVRSIGADLKLPDFLVNKTPIDGMSINEDGSYKSDEDKLGISYNDLDKLIRTGEATDEIRTKVFKMYNANLHKFDLKFPSFDPELPNYISEKNLPKWTKSQCEDAALW